MVLVSHAQTLSFAQVDSLTWALYQRGDHKALLDAGHDALRSGTDFYYLRMRMGEAAYKLNRLDEAAAHFNTVLEKYPEDSVAQEFVYYCYVFTGQDQRAASTAEGMSPSMRTRIGYRRKPVDAVGFEAGFLTNQNAKNYETGYMVKDNPWGLNFGKFAGPLHYGKVSLQHSFGPKLQLSHALAWFSTSTLGKFQAPNDTVQSYFRNGNLQYNLAASLQLAKGWKVSAGFGYYFQALSGYELISPDSLNPGPPRVEADTVYDRNVAGVVSVSKRFTNLELGLQLSLSNFPDTLWTQAQANVLWYPTGRSTFYTSTSLGLVMAAENQLIVTQRLGQRLSPHVWAEGFVSVGNHRNYLSSLGFVTWNTNDPILWMAGLNVPVYLGNLQLTPSYSYQVREGSYDTASPGLAPVPTHYRFDNHFFNLSVLWKF
jgi:hypothetical protein